MRKLILLFLTLLTCVACNRMRVKHDHRQKMQSVRVPVDTAQKDDVDDGSAENWMDEPITAVPEESEHVSVSRDSEDDVEKMLRGDDVY